ncbi:Rsp5p-dependent ubiquitination, sorting of cargo proteins at the multivesicular body [Podila minutissima]|nr:Rsp5p-dependent ubiquitination, sorting of cargo proteins at the multivesicular body [Podila minutissima]
MPRPLYNPPSHYSRPPSPPSPPPPPPPPPESQLDNYSPLKIQDGQQQDASWEDDHTDIETWPWDWDSTPAQNHKHNKQERQTQDTNQEDEDEGAPLTTRRPFHRTTSTYPPYFYRPTATYPFLPPTASPAEVRSSLFPVEYPTPEPGLPDSDDEDATWVVIIILSCALIITLSSVIRSCGQKAGWLTGSPNPNPNPGEGSRRHHRYGRSGYSGSGPHRVPEDNFTDPDETEERLAQLSDADRQAYEAAKAFQIVYPPGSVPTDISLSQYLSIQEKGVAAWEFEASYDHQLFVHDRTELSFYDREASVQTNLPLPKQQEVYYWEVKVFEKSPNTTISVGVSTKPFPTSRLPGWNRHSVGYFSKDGQKYCNSPWSGYPYGPIYFEGDVIGCGYRPRNGTIFFTRNGKKIEDAYTGYRTNLFPTVGATGPCVLHVNFGQSGFVFIEANVKKWGLAPASGSLAPPPAYGSELGSILLEAGSTQGQLRREQQQQQPSIVSSSSRRPIIQSIQSNSRSSSRVFVPMDDVNNRGEPATTTTFHPVHISPSNSSASPPNYSSLDRYHGQEFLQGAISLSATEAHETTRPTATGSETDEEFDDSDSDESVALLGEAQLAPEDP